ncbi:MAG: hypothetical protein ACXWCO_00655 [Caldimonas sp.]
MDEFTANDALGSGLDSFFADYDLAEEIRAGRADGSLLRRKARLLLEAMGFPHMAKVLANPNAPDSSKMDVLKFLLELGDMKPKQAQVASGGTGLTVNISLPAGFVPGAPQPNQGPTIIDITPDPLKAPDPEPPAEVPTIKIPDFKLGAPDSGRPIGSEPEPRAP